MKSCWTFFILVAFFTIACNSFRLKKSYRYKSPPQIFDGSQFKQHVQEQLDHHGNAPNSGHQESYNNHGYDSRNDNAGFTSFGSFAKAHQDENALFDNFGKSQGHVQDGFQGHQGYHPNAGYQGRDGYGHHDDHHGYGHDDHHGYGHDDHHGYGHDDHHGGYGKHDDHHGYGHDDHGHGGYGKHDDHHGYGHDDHHDDHHGYGHDDHHGYGHDDHHHDDHHGYGHDDHHDHGYH